MNDTANQFTERRRHKRYTYQSNAGPIFEYQSRNYKVIDISEGGLKIEVLGDADRPLHATSILSGKLRFSDSRTIQITAQLIWIIGKTMGLKLSEPIQPEIIQKEMPNFVPMD